MGSAARLAAMAIPGLLGTVAVIVWIGILVVRPPLPPAYFDERDARQAAAISGTRQSRPNDPLLILAERPVMHVDRGESSVVTAAFMGNIPAVIVATSLTDSIAGWGRATSFGYRRSSWIGAIGFMAVVFGQWYALGRLAIGLFRLVEDTQPGGPQNNGMQLTSGAAGRASRALH